LHRFILSATGGGEPVFHAAKLDHETYRGLDNYRNHRNCRARHSSLQPEGETARLFILFDEFEAKNSSMVNDMVNELQAERRARMKAAGPHR